MSRRLKPFAAFDAASGGNSAGENRTFDNLYPTNHGKFGIADMAAWKNIRHLALGADYTVSKQISARLAWHNLALEDSRDAWYNATGLPNKHGQTAFKDATGRSGRTLGDEIDLDVAMQTSKVSSLSAGVAVFRPGSFVRTVCGHSDNQLFGYVQFGTRF